MARRPGFIRKFNGKYYVRVLKTVNESIAQRAKQNIKARGDYALIIKSANTFQVWSRKKKK